MNGIGNIDSGLPLTLNQDGTNTYSLNLAASYKDVRIWKSALPNDVIVNWANQDITPSHPYYAQLLANWKCNETSEIPWQIQVLMPTYDSHRSSCL
jgi:hypothetical protein